MAANDHAAVASGREPPVRSVRPRLAPAGRPGGCPYRAVTERLRRCGMRPTNQRVMLGWLLFGAGDRHVSAEQLYEEASRAHIPVSLATVYNTLHAFAREGLVREVCGSGQRSWFDTNTSDHAHFFDEETGELMDIGGDVGLFALPEPPAGFEISSCEVIVRVRRRS